MGLGCWFLRDPDHSYSMVWITDTVRPKKWYHPCQKQNLKLGFNRANTSYASSCFVNAVDLLKLLRLPISPPMNAVYASSLCHRMW